jgi:prepilin-type N-terminal cleavage/methylation domain-containing protein
MNDFPHDQQSISPERMKSRAFTLIELLVVIAIIAILMGLLFPAAQSAINSAKKTTAKNQVIQIATAITAYETEYGRLPGTNSTNMGPALVSILCTTNDAINNPRGLIFLDSTLWKNGKGGTNSRGYYDPFPATNANVPTNIYNVSLDYSYANNQTNVALGGGFGTTNLTKHIMVWTTPVIDRNGTTVLINSWD